MSQKCPLCGLFNTEHAVRCDCGYDFVTKRVERSPVVPQLVDREGEARALRQSASQDIQTGIGLLALAAILWLGMFVTTGRVTSFPVVPTFWGILRLLRGLRVRRECPPPGAFGEPIRRL